MLQKTLYKKATFVATTLSGSIDVRSLFVVKHCDFGEPKPTNQPPHWHQSSDDAGAGGVFPRNSGGMGSGVAWCVSVEGPYQPTPKLRSSY